MYLKCIKNVKHTMNALFTGRFAETRCPKFLTYLPGSEGIWKHSCGFVISTNIILYTTILSYIWRSVYTCALSVSNQILNSIVFILIFTQYIILINQTKSFITCWDWNISNFLRSFTSFLNITCSYIFNN